MISANRYVVHDALYAALTAAMPNSNIMIRSKGLQLEIESDDEATALAVLNAHQAVQIEPDKQVINNDGMDYATLTFTATTLAAGDTITPTVEGVAVAPLMLDSQQQAVLEIDALDLADGETIEVGVQTYPHKVVVIEVQDAS